MNQSEATRRVREATDLVRLIGEHLALRARGREFVALCPFHDDKNPSLNVVPAKQIYKCFACGAGGDVFSFVMAYHKMTFPEALRYLAERANIQLPRGAGTMEEGASPRQRILGANQHALEFFRRTLAEARLGEAARQYIARRAISDEMVGVFQLGAAPDEWDALSRHAVARRLDLGALEQAGLIARRERGEGHYDKLRHRLIFPILDNLGRPIAFGGRVIGPSARDDASDAKYLNSPETAAFSKSATLFGLHAAQKPIIDSRTAIIVEGYTDVIACHQAGVRNVVATLGTALTPQHAALLRRYCDRVVLVFDGDEAGQKAADRAVSVFFSEPLDISIAVLPDGLDPGDLFTRADGLEIWNRALAAATDAMNFQFARVRGQFDSADSMAARQRIADEYLRKLVQLGVRKLDRQRYGLVFAQIAQLLGMSPGAVGDQIRRLSAAAGRDADGPAAPAGPVVHDLAERHLVGALLNRPELFDAELADGRPLSESLTLGDCTDTAVRDVFHALSEWLHEHRELSATGFREVFIDEPTLHLAFDLQLEADRLTGSDAQQMARQVVLNAQAIVQRRAETDYQRHKLEMRARPANDAHPDQEGRRLVDAVSHLAVRPATRRIPRIVGADARP
jgi:DNA primase